MKNEFSITKEQLQELAKGNAKVERWFPEAFEIKLEVGKWYKNTKVPTIFFLTSFTTVAYGYGIGDTGKWFNHTNEGSGYCAANDFHIKFLVPATKSEVFEALKKEAINIGFVEGAKYRNVNGDSIIHEVGQLRFDCGGLISRDGDGMIFNNGKWAEIIKETPEDFLNEIFSKDLICKTDKEKYPDSVFYFQGETCLLEIQKTSDKLYAWVNYSKIWNPISSKFGLNYDQTQQILKVMIEEHFKLSDVTPTDKK